MTDSKKIDSELTSIDERRKTALSKREQRTKEYVGEL